MQGLSASIGRRNAAAPDNTGIDGGLAITARRRRAEKAFRCRD